jgi:hypothetical protein
MNPKSPFAIQGRFKQLEERDNNKNELLQPHWWMTIDPWFYHDVESV